MQWQYSAVLLYQYICGDTFTYMMVLTSQLLCPDLSLLMQVHGETVLIIYYEPAFFISLRVLADLVCTKLCR